MLPVLRYWHLAVQRRGGQSNTVDGTYPPTMAFQGMSEKISPCSKSFVGGDITDKLGHGTHCAGLFCGNPTELPIPGPNTNSAMLFGGIAPDAKVMVCKVVQDGSSIANTGAVCEAIDHIIEYNRIIDSSQNGDRVNVISLSFGSPFLVTA